MFKFLFVALLLPSLGFAQHRETFTMPPAASPQTDAQTEVLELPNLIAPKIDPKDLIARPSLYRRAEADIFAYALYIPYDFPLRGKYGLSAGRYRDQNRSWEIEYLRGSVKLPGLFDRLGSIDEDRFGVLFRNYWGMNSFNISYGGFYNRFGITVGNDLMKYVNAQAGAVSLMQLETLGFTVGIGNRWIFKNNWSIGADWLTWNQPVWVTRRDAAFIDRTTNSDDKDYVETALKLFSYVPRLSLLKVQIGYNF